MSFLVTHTLHDELYVKFVSERPSLHIDKHIQIGI